MTVKERRGRGYYHTAYLLTQAAPLAFAGNTFALEGWLTDRTWAQP